MKIMKHIMYCFIHSTGDLNILLNNTFEAMMKLGICNILFGKEEIKHILKNKNKSCCDSLNFSAK